MAYKIFEYDPALLPYKKDIELRMSNYNKKKRELLENEPSLSDFANGSDYFGFHKSENGWYYREWAPAAQAVYLTGAMVDWRRTDLKLEKKAFIFFLTLIVSIVIEAIQLKIGRAFDIDDILLNMIGGILGYYVYRVIDKIFGNSSETIKGTLVVVSLLTLMVFLAIILI